MIFERTVVVCLLFVVVVLFVFTLNARTKTDTTDFSFLGRIRGR